MEPVKEMQDLENKYADRDVLKKKVPVKKAKTDKLVAKKKSIDPIPK
jgi:hypothetical protein